MAVGLVSNEVNHDQEHHEHISHPNKRGSMSEGAQIVTAMEAEKRGDLASLLRSDAFEAVVGLLVLTNAISMGIETNMDATSRGHPSQASLEQIQAVEFSFCVVF